MKISSLVDKVEPFEFHFDGEVLKGQYYKWKTQTPNYAKSLKAQLPDELLEGTAEELAANKKAREDMAEKLGEKMFLADTIVSWDMTEVEGGEIVPPSLEVLNSLPVEFTRALSKHFDELRNPKPNPPTASPVG